MTATATANATAPVAPPAPLLHGGEAGDATLGDSAFTAAQISQYLAQVGLPPSFHPAASPVRDLAYLTTLFTHQITSIPYENLTLHYSPAHAVTLDPQALFAKLVTDARGRGGYCMENSLFFNHVLRALGFDVYTAGARIRNRVNGVPQGPYRGFTHLVNVVTLPDRAASGGGEEGGSGGGGVTRYALDVGFGGDGPTRPLPMVEGLAYHNGVGTQEIRLARELIPAQRWRGPDALRMWVYQYRNGADRPWNSFYAFAEFEFTAGDFEIINFFASQSPESFQTFTVLAVKFLRGEETPARVVGKVMLVNSEVKRNVTGRTEVVTVCRTEADRLDALKQYFGITMTPEEAESIKGRVVDLDRPVAVSA